MKRINRVIHRITKGLFFKKTGKRLSDEYSVISLTPDELPIANNDKEMDIISNVIEPLKKIPHESIGRNVFDFKYFISKDDMNVSVWLYRFYVKTLFLVFTGKMPDLKK